MPVGPEATTMEGSNDATVAISNTNRPPFKYSNSLCWPGCRTIRIIELLPRDASFPNALEIKLHEADLDQKPKYDTVSYCWGGQQPTLPITCNGPTMNITENLAGALLAVSRDISEPIWLWADAICINQSDDLEKNLQVALMRDIYRTARIVHVWLGPDTAEDNIEEIFLVIEYIHSLLKPLDETSSGGHDDIMAALRSSIPVWELIDPQNYGHLFKLLSRPWFTHVWIIQEVILCQDALLYWGYFCIEWRKVLGVLIAFYAFGTLNRLILDYLDDSTGKRLICLSSFLHTWLDFLEPVENLSIFQVLVRHRTSLATDPRDKLYGPLGLVTEGMKLGIKVDYSIDIIDLFMDVATSVIVTY